MDRGQEPGPVPGSDSLLGLHSIPMGGGGTADSMRRGCHQKLHPCGLGTSPKYGTQIQIYVRVVRRTERQKIQGAVSPSPCTSISPSISPSLSPHIRIHIGVKSGSYFHQMTYYAAFDGESCTWNGLNKRRGKTKAHPYTQPPPPPMRFESSSRIIPRSVRRNSFTVAADGARHVPLQTMAFNIG